MQPHQPQVEPRPTRHACSVTGGLRRIGVRGLLDELADHAGRTPDAVVLGGGCAGLALGTAIVDAGGAVVVLEARRHDRDDRTWCYWDTGEALLPEAVSRSWDRWEVRTPEGRTVASDPAHPYRMVRAHDYRVAARARITGAGSRVVGGVRVVDDLMSAESVPPVVDARGAIPASAPPPGRTALHQRFVGRWIRAERPVFDDTTVTLMDFPAVRPGEEVRFLYVLPVAGDLALVECTVFSRSPHGVEPFREHIGAYLLDRWDLADGQWTVEGEEAGSIPMTDAPAPAPAPVGVGVGVGQRSQRTIGLRAGAARPSTGYAFTRIQAAARRTAAALAQGAEPSSPRDPIRTRVLDAIFLRFLRDRPELAPAVFLRMFDRLPGPLTVRFLTERSTLLDEVRLILALPKVPFLRAAARTARERARAVLP